MTLGKLWRMRTPERNVRRPGKARRESAYPAIELMRTTNSATEMAKMKVLKVRTQMERPASCWTLFGFHRKRQLSRVKPPIGVSPSIREKNDE